MPVTSVAVDLANGRHLFVGTVNGVLLRSPAGTTGNGAAWKRLGTGLPNVWVFSLSITADGSALVAWTHGRGAWLFRLADIVER
jgi:hypothetical protein